MSNYLSSVNINICENSCKLAALSIVQRNMKPVNETRIAVRIPMNKFPRLKRRLVEAAHAVNVDESVLVLAAVDGICSFVERYGTVEFPVRVTLHSLCESLDKIKKNNKK